MAPIKAMAFVAPLPKAKCTAKTALLNKRPAAAVVPGADPGVGELVVARDAVPLAKETAAQCSKCDVEVPLTEAASAGASGKFKCKKCNTVLVRLNRQGFKWNDLEGFTDAEKSEFLRGAHTLNTKDLREYTIREVKTEGDI